MARLEELTKGARVSGLVGSQAVAVVQTQWHGSNVLTLTYRDDAGRVGEQLLYRDDEARLQVETKGATWSFDADGRLFRLVSEARRISLAYLFDPFLAVHTSTLDPLPHQIEAVYEKMLPRQPLRFLLADDPGAGKTIMAGLLVKELMIRGDVARCLVVVPGSLVEQWQDELWSKFHLRFDILTRESIEASRTGNPFVEKHLLIARLDHLSRNEDLQAKLAASDWDLIVVDEAHKMAAHRFGDEVKETKRYKLGRLLGSLTRHFLLMTATPHSGKDEDFQLFMALLDSDRFEGRTRDGAHTIDASDLMRRLVKERLLRFDGRPLFPERRAYSPTYPLSEDEYLLYKKVTDYVTEEMNRAERLKAEGEGRRGNMVGFALTTMQRRLASSPEAIYQSLARRRKRLESRVVEERARKRGAEAELDAEPIAARAGIFDETEDGFDPDDLPDDELADLEEELVDQASAARTIAELEAEIATLQGLEDLARGVRNAGTDRKWEELSSLLEHEAVMRDPSGSRRKLIVFTEHRDTLNYLVEKLRTVIGRSEAVVAIHGGMGREDRRKAQESFVQDKGVVVLVATDAAGEGINLQRAHLMVNYDLPWNPNRIEQRFGRIHRIGQTQVCHLWNLVAADTREGQVFLRLFEKLEEQRRALGDQVFDVLGEAFRDRSLRDLLIEAIRYGERPDIKARLNLVVDEAVGYHVRELVAERALAPDVMTAGDVERIRDEMEAAEARRLQPHYIRSFFLEAFGLLGGRIVEREPGRYEITRVPAELRHRDRVIGFGAPLLRSYERVTFEKDLIASADEPLAEFCCPGHPLLDATIDVLLERYGSLLKQGAVLVDPTDDTETPRVLVYLEHAIQDGRGVASGDRRVVSKRFEFVEIPEHGDPAGAGAAPYLDYRPPDDDERRIALTTLDGDWLRADLDEVSLAYAAAELVPQHRAEVERRTVDRVARTEAAVRARLLAEITYWDRRANELKEQELAGKQPRLNSGKARQRADELQERLDRRLRELELERQLSPLPPVVVGGAVVVPAGLLARLSGERTDTPDAYARDTERVERAAVDAVLALERRLGRVPREMAHHNKGFDVLSKDPATGRLLFIEVKGRVSGAPTVTVTRSEILTGLNKPDDFVLALVEVPDASASNDEPVVRYLREPFGGPEESYFDVTSVNYTWKKLFEKAETPTPTATSWIPLMTQRIVDGFQPLRILLFGSQARAEADRDSDIDLLVVLPHVKDKRRAAVEIRRALADVPVPKDVVVTTPREIAEHGEAVGSVLRPALREGRVLYERAG